MANAYGHLLLTLKGLGRIDDQGVGRFDTVCHVVRDLAGTVRDVSALFKEHDVGIGIDTTGVRGRSRPRCHPTDDCNPLPGHEGDRGQRDPFRGRMSVT